MAVDDGESGTPSEEQSDGRGRDGKFLPGNPHKAPSFEKGKSGNPGGRPKGFQDITKRLQNYLGAEANWPDIQRLLGRALAEEAEVDVGLRALSMGLNNSQALMKAQDEPKQDAPPPVAQLEDGKEPEGDE